MSWLSLDSLEISLERKGCGGASQEKRLAGEEWDLDGGAETQCFAGKASICQGTERGRWSLNIMEPGDE